MHVKKTDKFEELYKAYALEVAQARALRVQESEKGGNTEGEYHLEDWKEQKAEAGEGKA